MFRRFRRWAIAGAFERVFKALRDDQDFEYVIADGAIVRVHQKATGAKEGRAIGRSRGGLRSKMMALVDGLGNLIDFLLMPRQRHDSRGVRALIEGLSFGAFLGDKAFDNHTLRADLHQRSAQALIPPRRNRIVPIYYDRKMSPHPT